MDSTRMATGIRDNMLSIVVGPETKTLGEILTDEQKAAMITSWEKLSSAVIAEIKDYGVVSVNTNITIGGVVVDPVSHANTVPVTGTGMGTIS